MLNKLLINYYLNLTIRLVWENKISNRNLFLLHYSKERKADKLVFIEISGFSFTFAVRLVMAEILVAQSPLTKRKRRSNPLTQYGILRGGGFSAAGNNKVA